MGGAKITEHCQGDVGGKFTKSGKCFIACDACEGKLYEMTALVQTYLARPRFSKKPSMIRSHDTGYLKQGIRY